MQSLATETFKIKNEMSPKMCPKPAQFPWNTFCQYCTQWNGKYLISWAKDTEYCS